MIKWLNIILTSIGLTFCVFAYRSPLGFYKLDMVLVGFPLMLFLLIICTNSIIGSSTDIKKQTWPSFICITASMLAILYLIYLVFIEKEGLSWKSFHDLGGGLTGDHIINPKVGYAGLIILICSWLITSLNLNQSTPEKLFETLSLFILFHVIFWIIVYFSYNIPRPIGPTSEG